MTKHGETNLVFTFPTEDTKPGSNCRDTNTVGCMVPIWENTVLNQLVESPRDVDPHWLQGAENPTRAITELSMLLTSMK